MDIFYELRHLAKPEDRIAIDLARHLQTRHILGPALVVCDNPHALMSAVRKQWLRLARSLQRQRASTINAEEILRHTKAIMYMQNAQFTIKSPIDLPGASVYFQPPTHMQSFHVPPQCISLYVANGANLPPISQLAKDALVVFYDTAATPSTDLSPRQKLEESALAEWKKLTNILDRYKIDSSLLSLQDTVHQKALDHALDTLIVEPNEFLQQAYIFQQAIDKAQPVQQISLDYQRQFEAVSRLAYRVNTLTPRTKPAPLAAALTDNENYFLRDSGTSGDTMAGLLICNEPIYHYSATI